MPNVAAIRRVCRELVVLWRPLDLFSQAVVAIDCSKFKTVNNRERNYTWAKLQRRIEQIMMSVARYELDSADRQGAAPVAEASTTGFAKGREAVVGDAAHAGVGQRGRGRARTADLADRPGCVIDG